MEKWITTIDKDSWGPPRGFGEQGQFFQGNKVLKIRGNRGTQAILGPATFAYSRARACCACSRCGMGGLYFVFIFHLSSLCTVLSFERWLNMTEILWFRLLNPNSSCQLLPRTSSLSIHLSHFFGASSENIYYLSHTLYCAQLVSVCFTLKLRFLL